MPKYTIKRIDTSYPNAHVYNIGIFQSFAWADDIRILLENRNIRDSISYTTTELTKEEEALCV